VGVVVTCCTGAPALFGITNTSGGLVTDEWMSAIMAPSGDTSPAFEPSSSSAACAARPGRHVVDVPLARVDLVGHEVEPRLVTRQLRRRELEPARRALLRGGSGCAASMT